MKSDPYIRDANEQDVDAICLLLHTKMNAKIKIETWRNLMSYDWLENKPNLGKVITDNQTILGYIGMIYADRQIKSTQERIVNITSWYLHKSVRGLGLGKQIMVDAINDPTMAYTILTSSKKTLGLLKEVGYTLLDDQRFIWHKQQQNSGNLRIISDPETIMNHVCAEHIKLVSDFKNFRVTPVLVISNNRQCLLLVSIEKKANEMTYYYLLYCSDRSFIGRHGQDIANMMLPDQSSVFAADCRFVSDNALGARLENLAVARYYKSNHLQPENIDYLYNELQLLNLKLD